MRKAKWIKVQVLCVKRDANQHSIKDDDMYIEEQWIRHDMPVALLKADPKYYPEMAKGILVTAFNQLPVLHTPEELIEMFSLEE